MTKLNQGQTQLINYKPCLLADLALRSAENAPRTLSNSSIIHWFLSKGKTSLIRYLLERDYPGLRIGPEPTTDCFNAVMYGDQEQARILKRGVLDRHSLL